MGAQSAIGYCYNTKDRNSESQNIQISGKELIEAEFNLAHFKDIKK